MEIRWEGVTSDEQGKMEVALASLNKVLQFSLTVGDNRILPWFGSSALKGGPNYKAFDARRNKMAKYVKDQCTLLTFVKKIAGLTVDCAEVESGDIAQVIRSSFGNTFDEGAFVPSGLRVFLLPSFALVPPRRHFHTLTHELTHRVLLTTDWWYGEANCQQKAKVNDPKCLDTAANWGWFYADVKDPGPA
jgi:hypothetical protein